LSAIIHSPCMIEEQIKFYDAASADYSQKRYEGKMLSYIHYIFRKRLSIFLEMFQGALPKEKKHLILEIGCADGIVVREILTKFSNSVEKITGLDVSPGMIERAKVLTKDTRADFVLRGDEQGTYDIVMELGVHVSDLEKEISYINSLLKPGGLFFYSNVGRKSSFTRIKLKNAPHVSDYMTYAEMDVVLLKHFEIVDSKAYGLFIPKLWAFPMIARILQPLFDLIVRPFAPELFHEKIYLLRKKR
jgi:2-polyprenyl-3-methyl-5-hydroxy-6-metoxy-1,4-benzoquinol methylase